MKGLKALDIITFVLLIIGGLNWGLVGFFGFDLVAALFGDMTIASRIIYSLVGLAALYEILSIKAIQHRWGITYHSHHHPAHV